MPGESAWPTSYDYNWCENTAQGQTKTGPQVTRASAKTNVSLESCKNNIKGRRFARRNLAIYAALSYPPPYFGIVI